MYSTPENTKTRKQFYQLFKKIDVVIVGLSLLFLLLKLNHIEGINLFLVLTMGATAQLTFMFGFGSELVYDIKNNFLPIILNVAVSILIVASLFFLMFWPESKFMANIGLVMAFISVVWIASSLEKGIFNFRQLFNKVLIIKLFIFGGISLWGIAHTPLERFELLHKLGKDPVAKYLYEEKLKDPRNTEKQKKYMDYVRSKK